VGNGGRGGQDRNRVVEPGRRMRKINRNSFNSYKCYNNIGSRIYFDLCSRCSSFCS
jgi:hypothetical protein